MSDSYSSGEEHSKRPKQKAQRANFLANPLHVLNMKLNPNKDFVMPPPSKSVMGMSAPKARDSNVEDLVRSTVKNPAVVLNNADDGELEFEFKMKAPVSQKPSLVPQSRNVDGAKAALT